MRSSVWGPCWIKRAATVTASWRPNAKGLWTTIPRNNEESVLNTLMTHFSGLLGLRLLPMLREQEPDLILSTHPFATEMISHLKEKGLVQAPLICLMTDYGPHRAWIAPRWTPMW